MIIELPKKFITPFTGNDVAEGRLTIRSEVFGWLLENTPGIKVSIKVNRCESNLPIKADEFKVVTFQKDTGIWFFATISIEFETDSGAIHFKMRWWDTEWDEPKQVTAQDILNRIRLRSGYGPLIPPPSYSKVYDPSLAEKVTIDAQRIMQLVRERKGL